MKRKKASKGILVDVALLLLCLVCITSCISSGILAKFTTGSQSANTSRTARFSVSATKKTGEEDSEITDDNNSVGYEVEIKNDSETAVYYDIVLHFNMSVVDIVSIEYNNNTYEASSDKDEGTSITIKNAGQLASNASATSSFELSVDLEKFTEAVTSGEATIDFDTLVCFTQID